jgi:hypothetical protein
LTEFSSADLDRLLGEARATLKEMRADRPVAAGNAKAVGEATGGDAGGRVTATAERGRLTAVEFDREARMLPSADLAGLVVTAVNAALDGLRPVPAAPPAGTGEQAPRNQVELLTQAINEALGRIG